MGTEIIETKQVGEFIYRIVLLDNKYTVYAKKKLEKEKSGSENNEFSARASFDDIKSAREYIESRAEGKDSKNHALQ